MNYLRNMWYPWTSHWEDQFDPRFLVRMRWKIVVTVTDFQCLFGNLKRNWSKPDSKVKSMISESNARNNVRLPGT